MEKKTLIVDQSSTCCGYALLDGRELREHGNLTSRGKTATLRLGEFERDLHTLAWDNDVDEIVFERIHYHGLPSADAIEGLAPGAYICKKVAEELGLPWYRIPPQSWKAACGVSGKGREAQKRAAKRAACNRWGLEPDDILSSDHSDALCIAAYWIVFADDYRKGIYR